MFECGTLKCHVENIKMNQGWASEYAIPVPGSCSAPPRAVVIDGGNAAECATDARGHWGAICDVYWPDDDARAGLRARLARGRLRPRPTSVRRSNLTCTSTTRARWRPSTSSPTRKVVATRAEYEYAHAPDWFAAGGYIRADYNKPGIDWLLLEGNDDGYDLYGDGTLRMWQTPGHAPGHQSFEIALANTGSVLLTVDAAYTMDHWNEKALPGFLASAVDSVRSVRKLHRIAERSGSTVVTGHDPEAWPAFKQAPEHYD